MVCLNLVDFLNDGLVGDRKTTKLSKRSNCSVVVARSNQVSGCFWKKEHSDNEDKRPCKLHCDGDTV